MQTRLRKLWDEGKAGVNGWLSIPSTVTAELTARQGYDSIVVDLQHGLNDYSDALALLQAISVADVTPMARVPWLEPGIIMKLLDAGALGIICPMINTGEEAERFVAYSNYAPKGERSVGPTRAVAVYGPDYLAKANDAVITMAMVETTKALDNLGDIVGTPGLTGVYVGPSDLSLSLGFESKPDHDEPKVVDAIKSILEAAHGAGIKAGIHCLAPSYAKEMIALGFDFVTVGTDVRIYLAGLAATLGPMRS